MPLWYDSRHKEKEMKKFKQEFTFVPKVVRFKSLYVKFTFHNGKDVYFYNCLYDFVDDLLHGDLIRSWQECTSFEVKKVKL